MERLRRRRSLPALAMGVLALSLGLAACGGGDEDDAAEAVKSATAAAADATSEGGTSAAESTEPVTITSWNHWKGQPVWEKTIKELDAEFMKQNPNITVKQVSYASESYDLKLKAAVASNSLPDVIWSFGFDQKSVRPLDDLITDEQRENLTLLQNMVSPIDQKIHFVPYGAYGEVFLVNRAVWEKAGLDPDAQPKTWDEFMSTCDKFNQAGIQPIAYGFKDPWTAIRPFAAVGGQLFTIEQLINEYGQAKVPWSDARVQKALDLVYEATVDHKCFGERPETQLSTEAFKKFQSGEAAMSLAAAAYPNPLGDVDKKIGAGNLDFMPWPLVEGAVYDEPTVDGGNNNLFAISCKSEHADAAWKYISFYLDKHAQEVAFKYTNQYPNHLQADVSQAQTPLDAKMAEALKNPDMHYGTWQVGVREGDVFNRNIPLFLGGRMDKEKFTEGLQKVRDEEKEQKARELERAKATC